MMDSKAESLLSSEIFHLSLDSNEGDTGTSPAWYSVIRNLTKEKIQPLHEIFQEKTFKQKLSKADYNFGLNKDEFVSALNEIYGNSNYSFQSVLLFEEIDKSDKKEITWDNFIDFLIENLSIPPPKKLELNVTHIFPASHAKRDAIVKIVPIESDSFFCYTIVSKYGHVGIYDGSLNFLISYHVIMGREDIHKKDEERRRKNRWITDAIFCNDLQMFVVSNSCRNLIIYEASGLKHVPLWLIISIPNAVFTLQYHYSQENEKSILFMGDDVGQILSFTFSQPKNGLFEKKQDTKLSLLYWIQMNQQTEFYTLKKHGKIHNNIVRQIRYFPETECIVSCSTDPAASVVNKHLMNRRKSLIFKMQRGTTCFDQSIPLKILITGSNDGFIRIWDPIVTKKPVTTFHAHEKPVIDLKIFEKDELLLSCSCDGVLKIWDLRSHVCLQQVKIKYPVFHVLGKVIEWGKHSIYSGPKQASNSNTRKPTDIWRRSNILVTCCNYIAKIKCDFFDDSIQYDFEMPILPPPPLQNSVLVPDSWKISDETVINKRTPIEPIKDENIEKYMTNLDFILKKEILKENGFTYDINYKIANLETTKLKMKGVVAKGAPYLALDLSEIEDLNLPPGLPLPTKNCDVKLVDSIQRMISNASFKDVLFSEPSSSRSRSSKSSVVEFEA